MDACIEDYALIGDCETAALVSRTGSIDWLCLPRFDAPACFAALLGTADNGCWSIRPDDAQARITRRYRDGTLILETRFETATGAATLIDFMAVREPLADLVRIVVGEWGVVDFTTKLTLRFDYGRTVPWVTRADAQTLTAVAGPDQIVVQTPVALKGEDHHTVGRFTVRAGARIPFTMTYQSSLASAHQAVDPEAALARTENFWRAFSDRCPQVGHFTQQVKRSLITLKALTYAPTGGIVAAATTSLPEWIGWRPASAQIDDLHVQRLINARVAARKAKDFAESDRIRDELVAMGIQLRDGKGPDGELITQWEVKI